MSDRLGMSCVGQSRKAPRRRARGRHLGRCGRQRGDAMQDEEVHQTIRLFRGRGSHRGRRGRNACRSCGRSSMGAHPLARRCTARVEKRATWGIAVRHAQWEVSIQDFRDRPAPQTSDLDPRKRADKGSKQAPKPSKIHAPVALATRGALFDPNWTLFERCWAVSVFGISPRALKVEIEQMKSWPWGDLVDFRGSQEI